MSFRRPKVSNRRSSATQPTSTPSLPSTPTPRIRVPQNGPSAVLIDVNHYPRQQRPRHTRNLFSVGPEPLLALPGGIRLTQVYDLNDPTLTSPQRQISPEPQDHDPIFDDVFSSPHRDSDINGHRRKERQWKQWTTDVIPSYTVSVHTGLVRLPLSDILAEDSH